MPGKFIIKEECTFREAFYNAESNSFLAVKKIGNLPNHVFHKSPKSRKQRFQEKTCRRCSVRTEVRDELPACPGLGTGGARTSPGPLLALLQPVRGLPLQAVCYITDLRT